MWRAWVEGKANGGEAGIDGVSIEDIEAAGVPDFLDRIAEDLKEREYHPKPVRRVYIPKPDGKKRLLGIPTVRDRVIQQACRIVIEPVFEALFEDCRDINRWCAVVSYAQGGGIISKRAIGG